MKKVFVLLVVIIGIIFFTGCSKIPTPQEAQEAYYGKAMKDVESAKNEVKSYFEERAYDSDSLKYRWGEVFKGWVMLPDSLTPKPGYGYILPVKVNAKNRMGGYVGYKQYYFLFNDGKIAAITPVYDFTKIGKIE